MCSDYRLVVAWEGVKEGTVKIQNKNLGMRNPFIILMVSNLMLDMNKAVLEVKQKNLFFCQYLRYEGINFEIAATKDLFLLFPAWGVNSLNSRVYYFLLTPCSYLTLIFDDR